ncbi:baseplate assembly protein [Undibacterium umbellatum]|uniref:Baseplate J/gp47 family protein n=1 Tax=Undibacterium umbellatum TaxID=2762300 RepID=A0ABR6ZIM1_9BURK|nr:baseplate J/gp47 family protein [Undibacterium umbellatum]MBC3911544.1 baseplate J/gp47 family protein [Undibacterium umbellatum]
MIDLTKLPPPAVVEVLDFEALVNVHKQDLLQRQPSAANVLALPSEPLVKQVEAFAYREMLLRGRINDAARANLLAFATGTDLDHKGAFYNLARLSGEADERYRNRIQLRIAALAGNGTAEQYHLLALSASANVRDANVTSATPGSIAVVLWLIDASQAQATSAAVLAAMNAPNARPLGVAVKVVVARPAALDVTATLWREASAPADIVTQIKARFIAAIASYASLGRSVPLSWVTAQLQQPGIARVEFPIAGQPASNTVLAADEYAIAGAITLTDGGVA